MRVIKTKSQVRKLLKRYSLFLPRQIDAHPEDLEWLLKDPSLTQGRTLLRFQAEWKSMKWDSLSLLETFTALRTVKRREMLRITIRDLAYDSPLDETVAELSVLADFCLQRALDPALKEIISKHGSPQAPFAIFGLGKLGGQELNYSSDIDLIFVYSEEGTVGRLTHHDFFTRVAESIVQGFRSHESNSCLFRIDLRLRPEGNSGPITRSLESYENYYAAFGEVWERMALQKARLVAGSQELGYEFIQHLQPFCFPKYLSPSALDEIFQIKSRIEAEILKEGGLERHVKLGKGGIREIEFSVQALQLLHGARNAFSQERGTLKSLQALQRLELLTAADAAALTRAYIFLRRLEHRLQMREDRQTHVVPEDKATQAAIAKGLSYKSHSEFESEWRKHIEFVRSFFHGIVRPKRGEEQKSTALESKGLSLQSSSLKKVGFKDPEKAAVTLQTLAHGPEYAHVSQRTRGLFQQLCPYLLKIIPQLGRPDFALQQFERFIEAYGSRSVLYELLTSHPKNLELLFKLFDQSLHLTNIIVQQPSLLESIAFEGLLSISRTKEEMEIGLKKELGETVESRLRSFRNAELLRIELRDILGLSSSLEETWIELSRLADVCLSEAVRAVTTSGYSRVSKTRKLISTSFCIVGLGKYGGEELSYGSDLDVIFVGGSAELASRVMAMMSQEQNNGIVFKMDARLRPDGEDGSLTLPLEAYARYYEKRAQFWERQALTRARIVAGDPKLGEAFLKLVDQIIYSRPPSAKELKEMAAMRERIEKERGDPSDPERDFKTGVGGLVDVEFLAQAQQLLYGYRHIPLRRASTLEVLRKMPEIAGWKKEDIKLLMEDYIWLRKLESALRCFSHMPISQLPSSRDEWGVLAKQLNLKDAVALQSEMMSRRKKIRKLIRQFSSKEKK